MIFFVEGDLLVYEEAANFLLFHTHAEWIEIISGAPFAEDKWEGDPCGVYVCDLR